MFLLPSPIQELTYFEQKNVRLWVKREDLIHPNISGNKYRKLIHNLHEAKALHITTLVTMGGAFSNHIHAVAAAGKFFNFQTIGFIRGEKIQNPTLEYAEKQGMKLIFLNRTAYATLNETTIPSFLAEKISNYYFLPEGGTNKLAIQGVAEMIGEINMELGALPDVVCCACGTGGTFTGIVEGLSGKQKALGVAVLKGGFMEKEVRYLQETHQLALHNNWEIKHDYHFGGYAKHNSDLVDFIRMIEKKYGLLLDPIYTGKMMYAIFDLIEKDFFSPNTTILAVHTGGLQGWEGWEARFGKR